MTFPRSSSQPAPSPQSSKRSSLGAPAPAPTIPERLPVLKCRSTRRLVLVSNLRERRVRNLGVPLSPAHRTGKVREIPSTLSGEVEMAGTVYTVDLIECGTVYTVDLMECALTRATADRGTVSSSWSTEPPRAAGGAWTWRASRPCPSPAV